MVTKKVDIMNHIISVLLDNTIASSIGKKGSENSITYYNGTYNGEHISMLTPTSIEDKVHAVAESILLSEQVVIGTQNINKFFGEVVLACSLTDKRILITKDSDVSDLLKGVDLKDATLVERDNLLNGILSYTPKQNPGDSRVDIDKAFNVKGIGLVVLGIVTRGAVNVHDKMVLTSGKEVMVKSIQSNDVDITSATTNTRVGLAIKGATAGEISKGDLLSKEHIAPSSDIHVDVHQIKIRNEEIKPGNSYSMVSNFSYTNATVINTDDTSIHLRADRPVPLEVGDKIMLIRNNTPRIFAYCNVLSLGE